MLSEEKHMLMGAFTAGGLEAVFDGYFGYKLAGGVNVSNTPTDPAYLLYAYYTPWLPNLSQVIPWFAVPALLYYAGKKKRSPKLKAMGEGGLVFGVAELVGTTAFKLSAVATGNTFTVVSVR